MKFWTYKSTDGFYYSECCDFKVRRVQDVPHRKPTWHLAALIREVPTWHWVDEYKTLREATERAQMGGI